MKRKLRSSIERLEEDLKEPIFRAAYAEALGEQVSETLRSLRDARGALQGDVAERMGLSRPRVAQIESADGKGMTLETVARYAQAVGYSACLVFEDSALGGEEATRVYLTPDPVYKFPIPVTPWSVVAQAQNPVPAGTAEALLAA